jgi:class 3 adenylate cyclase
MTNGDGQLDQMRGSFARGVMESYSALGRPSGWERDVSLSQESTLRATADPAHDRLAQPMGHPAFQDLAIGGTGHCDAAVAFMDLTDFTSRSFWETPEDMVRLARSVLTQIIEVVADFGGHVLGLRGDGVFCAFGGPDSQDPALDATLALGACAFALDATQSALNGLLEIQGLRRVQLRAGADYGRLDFVRTGTREGSEVNVISFAANFASKCEKYANSWELVVGKGLANHVPNRALLTAHDKSPKPYERNGERRTYPFYQVHWHALLSDLPGIREELAGSPSSRARIV